MKKLTALMASALLMALPANAVLINEIQPNPVGADPSTQQVELLGMAGQTFLGYILSIESDSSSALGTIDRVSEISGTFDSNGLLTFDIGDLENPSFTLVLTDSFTGSVGDDIDTDDDGIADDLSLFGTVLDALGMPDAVGDEATVYGAQLGGLDFAYTGDEPQLIFRDSISLAWFAINDPAGSAAIDIMGDAVDFSAFDSDPTMTTFGAVNPTAAVVPVPAALWLFVSAVGFLGLRRK